MIDDCHGSSLEGDVKLVVGDEKTRKRKLLPNLDQRRSNGHTTGDLAAQIVIRSTIPQNIPSVKKADI